LPPGKVLFRTSGTITHVRVHPDGNRIAFVDHPNANDTAGSLKIVNLQGVAGTLSEGWADLRGLAWSVDGDEVWFTGSRPTSGLYAVGLNGRERLITRVPGSLILHDISRNGQVLLTRDTWRQEVRGAAPQAPERDLTWLDSSTAMDLSADGRTLLFTESALGGGEGYSVYFRTTDGSTATRLGSGAALALSPDGQSALAVTGGTELIVLPVGPGASRALPRGPIERYHSLARWSPDGHHVVFAANEPGQVVRLYIQDVQNGSVKPITPEVHIGGGMVAISPDGSLVAARNAERVWALYPIAGGAPRPLPELHGQDVVLGWTSNGAALYIYRYGELPAKVSTFDLVTGKSTVWKLLMPPDGAGVGQGGLGPVLVTPDGSAYAYTFARLLSELYLVDGLR
jgi:eukaryotic-like serine/threonine-protein kinase